MGSSSVTRRPEGDAVIRISIEDLGAHVAMLEAELRDGRAIELTSGDTVIGEVQPVLKADTKTPPVMPDFMAMLREIYGDKPLDVDTTEWIREGRE